MQCWKCRSPISNPKVFRSDTCEKCGADARVCRNCGHYDTTLYNGCKEPQADRVVDKEKANFCDYFTLNTVAADGPTPAELARAAAEALFKKK